MAVATTPTGRVQLEIDGMTCASCATRIEKKLNKLQGVEATVNYATEEAAVRFDPGQIEVEQLIAAVEATGYHASLPSETAEDEDPTRALRLRLTVAVVLGVPLALLAMASPLQFPGWEWVALGLSTPIVLWAGWQFHRATAQNARHGAATMDTLISIGTLAAWLWSTTVLVGGLDAHTYFEVGGVITTLILLGRYLEARARRRSGQAIRAAIEEAGYEAA